LNGVPFGPFCPEWPSNVRRAGGAALHPTEKVIAIDTGFLFDSGRHTRKIWKEKGKAVSKLIVGVSVNGTAIRAENHAVPRTIEEIVEDARQCHLKSASIVQVSNRFTEQVGQLPDSDGIAAWSMIVRQLRVRCDVIAYPTWISVRRSKVQRDTSQSNSSVPALPELSEGLVEMITLHPEPFAPGGPTRESGARALDDARSAIDARAIEFLTSCLAARVKVRFGVGNVEQVRQVLTYRDLGLIDDPLIFDVHPVDGGAIGSLGRALLAILSAIPSDVPYEWFAHHRAESEVHQMNDDFNRELNILAVALGGHVMVDSAEEPPGGEHQLQSAEVVDDLVAVAKAVGREVATTDETRVMLGLPIGQGTLSRTEPNEISNLDPPRVADSAALIKVSYVKPTLRRPRGVVRLGSTDIMSALVQVMAEGARQGLHALNAYDGIYFVLSGRVQFFGDGGGLFAAIGENEAVIVPRGVTYGFEAVGGEAEVFYVNSIDRRTEDLFVSREKGSDAFDFDRFNPDGEPINLQS
jgi:3-keto-5-aminohexanoate cleavage enzyme